MSICVIDILTYNKSQIQSAKKKTNKLFFAIIRRARTWHQRICRDHIVHSEHIIKLHRQVVRSLSLGFYVIFYY